MIISCLSSGGAYFSLGISLSWLFVTASEIFSCESFETIVILLTILLLIKSPVASAVFSLTLFEKVLIVSAADCLAWS